MGSEDIETCVLPGQGAEVLFLPSGCRAAEWPAGTSHSTEWISNAQQTADGRIGNPPFSETPRVHITF